MYLCGRLFTCVSGSASVLRMLKFSFRTSFIIFEKVFLCYSDHIIALIFHVYCYAIFIDLSWNWDEWVLILFIYYIAVPHICHQHPLRFWKMSLYMHLRRMFSHSLTEQLCWQPIRTNFNLFPNILCKSYGSL